MKKKEEQVQMPQVLRTFPFPNPAEPLGSYTGRAPERMEIPVQDADDL